MILQINLTILTLIFSATTAFADDKRPLKMMYTVWEPFIYEDEDAKPHGFNIDIVRILIEEKLGRKLILQSAPWKRVQAEVLQGRADMFCGIPTEERRQSYMIGQEALFKVKVPIYTYKNHPRLDEIRNIRKIEDILNLKLTAIAVNGNGWHEKNVEAAGVPTLKVAAAKNIYRVLSARRADIAVYLQNYNQYSQGSEILPPDIVDTDVILKQLSSQLILSRSSNHNIDLKEMDAALIEMHEGGIVDDVFAKYLF